MALDVSFAWMARRGWGVLPIVVAFLVWMVSPALAAPVSAPQVDLVLLIDRSGSMAKNDPTDLAATGAKVMLGLLDPGDRVAIVPFDTTARADLGLSPLGDGAAARRAVEGLGRPVGQWTDIKGALAAAVALLNGQAAADRQPVVVLLTDGQPQTRDDGVPPGYHEDLNALVSQMAGRSIPVFTVGLGQADFDLLNRIAATTHAESFAATSSTQVVKLFTDVLSRVKERHILLTLDEADVSSGQVRTLQVPPYTRLLTLSAVSSAGGVQVNGQSPSGSPLAAVPGLKTSTGANYVVYAIPNPAPGTWTIRLNGQGRVQAQGQAESALRLLLLTPTPYSQVTSADPSHVRVQISGDADPASPLEVWIQVGSGEPSRLIRNGDAFEGQVRFADGRVLIWATRAGLELTRREFRVYPGPSITTSSPPGVESVPSPSSTKERWLATIGLAAVAMTLLGWCFGLWNWRRLRRREERVTGRLGSLSFGGIGAEAQIGPGPALVKQGTGSAVVFARLMPIFWPPLARLGVGRRQVHMFIRQAPGVRLQINGRPAGDGRLHHGDSVQLGHHTYLFYNPQLGRRPMQSANRRVVPLRTKRL